MKKTKLILAISLLGLLGGVYHAAAIGTAFTYQGRLADNGSPASGNYDLQFTLWDSAVGGLQVGSAVVVAPVSVSGGLFTVPLDFGAGIFTCPDRWLQIEARVFGGPTYSLISGRQQLTPTPYAITANSVCATPGAVQDVSLSPNVALLDRSPQMFTGANSFAGNVGIGTTTPGAKLQINAGAGAGYHTDAIIGYGGYASGEEHSINFDDSLGHIGSLIVGYDGTDGYFSAGNLYYAGGHTTGTTAFRVFGNGNVDIDPANLNAGFLNNGNTNGSGLTFGTGSGEGIASKRTAGGNQNGLDFYTSFTTRMSILNGGFVGIGRQTAVTGSDIFAVRSPVTSGYGGMYLDTAGATAQPFYGYALNGSAVAWTYLDGADGNKWKVYNGGDRVTVTTTGSVGIGTTTPTQAKLVVNGNVSGTPHPGNVSLLNSGGVIANVTAGTDPVSILASDDIFGAVFIAFSDARIKRIEGRSDAARDLATLLGLEVTDYTYIDTAVKGTGKQKKLIAQQVEKVYPQAVHRHTDVVPDIYQKAKVEDGWVKLATNLKKGERVRLISGKREGIHEVLEVAQDKFRTDFVADGDEVFVYGREVNDFRSVDYEAIAMLNVSATQELNRRLEKQAAEIAARDGRIATLEKANQEMQRELAAQKELASHLQAEFATVRKAVARLADKSANTFALNQSPAEAQ